MVTEHADVGLNPFIVVLHLSLCLRVVWCGESLIDVEGLEESLCVLGGEGGASVCVVYLGDPV